MELPNNKKSALATLLIFSLLGLGLGLLLILLDVAFLIKVVFVVVGIFTILFQLPSVVAGIASFGSTKGKLLLIFSLLSVALGFLMIFWHNTFLTVFLGLYLLILPLVEILLSGKQWRAQLKTELPKMIIGVVLLLIGPNKAFGLIFDIAGWVILVLTVIYALIILLSIFHRARPQNTTGGRIFVDHDGDGKIDTVYVDTTGDGKADTATRYRDNK